MFAIVRKKIEESTRKILQESIKKNESARTVGMRIAGERIRRATQKT